MVVQRGLRLVSPLLGGLLAVCGLFIIFGSPAATAVASDPPGHVAGEVVIRLDLLTGATITDVNTTYGSTTISQIPNAPIYQIQAPNGTSAEALVSMMDGDVRLIYAELNYFHLTPEIKGFDIWAFGGPDPTPYDTQYALALMDVLTSHAVATGEGVIVAVLDTGVQHAHPALTGSLTLTQADFIDGDGLAADAFNGLDDDGDGDIDEAAGHGTHVAGVIRLAAPGAQIMPVRILDSDGQGNVFALAEGINFAVDNGADVINLSLGLMSESDLLADVLRTAARRGVFVAAAAGNDGSSLKQFPAADECALAVTAVDPQRQKLASANFGDWIALSVPGQSIYSAFPDDAYAWWTGTSMATPFVAAQAALIYSLDDSLSPRFTAQIMAATAQNLDPFNPQYGGLLGAGLPRYTAALQLVQSAPTELENEGLMGGTCETETPLVSVRADAIDVTISWRPDPDGEETFAVYRSGDPYHLPGPTTLIVTGLPEGTTRWVDSHAVLAATPFFYRVVTTDDEAILSKPSRPVGIFPFALVSGD